MQLISSAAAALLALAAHVDAHGLVTKPATRQPGAATQAVCGAPMVNFYKADNTSYPEALKRNTGWDVGFQPAKCDLYKCKGFQFADNQDHVLTYRTGEVVPIEVFIRIPHRGYANVSVIDLATNKVIGEPLRSWAKDYAAVLDPPKDQTSFNVTIPALNGKCATPGACAIQWYWLGQGQTYESCIDFTVPNTTVAARSFRA